MFDTKQMRRLAVRRTAALLACIAIAGVSGARAMPTCQGTYAATPLLPLPAEMIVDLDIHDRSQRNLMLADRFLAGVRDAGVPVGQNANVLLHVTTSRFGEISSRSGASERSYPDLNGLQGGGKQPTLPPLVRDRITAPQPRPAAPPLLVIRVDATEDKATRIAWIASVQCQMTGSDEGQLAQELGRAIGGVLGQKIERRPF